jgi:hypothetical protein
MRYSTLMFAALITFSHLGISALIWIRFPTLDARSMSASDEAKG